MIWGHEIVHVDKDPMHRRWIVSTTKPPRQQIVVVAWKDIYRTFTDQQRSQYLDYIEAITTCQSHRNTQLTGEEERQALLDFEHDGSSPARVPAPARVKAPATTPAKPLDGTRSNVVSMVDFKRRKT